VAAWRQWLSIVSFLMTPVATATTQADISQSHDRTVDDHHEVAAGSNDSSGVEARRQLVDRFRH